MVLYDGQCGLNGQGLLGCRFLPKKKECFKLFRREMDCQPLAFHEAFDVALKTCPENPVAYTRAISDPGSQYHFFDLALCLHGHSVALEGITFRFVVNIQAIQGAMQLEIGLDEERQSIL